MASFEVLRGCGNNLIISVFSFFYFEGECTTEYIRVYVIFGIFQQFAWFHTIIETYVQPGLISSRLYERACTCHPGISHAFRSCRDFFRFLRQVSSSICIYGRNLSFKNYHLNYPSPFISTKPVIAHEIITCYISSSLLQSGRLELIREFIISLFNGVEQQ